MTIDWMEPTSEAQRQRFIAGRRASAKDCRTEAAMLRIDANRVEGLGREYDRKADELEARGPIPEEPLDAS